MHDRITASLEQTVAETLWMEMKALHSVANSDLDQLSSVYVVGVSRNEPVMVKGSPVHLSKLEIQGDFFPEKGCAGSKVVEIHSHLQFLTF